MLRLARAPTVASRRLVYYLGDTLRVSPCNHPPASHATTVERISGVGVRSGASRFSRPCRSCPHSSPCRRRRRRHSGVTASRRQSGSRRAHASCASTESGKFARGTPISISSHFWKSLIHFGLSFCTRQDITPHRDGIARWLQGSIAEKSSRTARLSMRFLIRLTYSTTPSRNSAILKQNWPSFWTRGHARRKFCHGAAALTVDMIHKISETWKIPADLLVRRRLARRAAGTSGRRGRSFGST